MNNARYINKIILALQNIAFVGIKSFPKSLIDLPLLLKNQTKNGSVEPFLRIIMSGRGVCRLR